MPSENASRDGKGVVDCATVDVPTMDGDTTQNAHQRTAANNEKEERTAAAVGSRGTPHHKTLQVDGISIVRQQLRARGISAAGTDIIMASWRPATDKQYRPHVNKWIQFCDRGHINPLNPAVTDIVNFLSDTFHRGVGYDSVNTRDSCGRLQSGKPPSCQQAPERGIQLETVETQVWRDLGRQACAAETENYGTVMQPSPKRTNIKTSDANGTHASSQSANITFVNAKEH